MPSGFGGSIAILSEWNLPTWREAGGKWGLGSGSVWQSVSECACASPCRRCLVLKKKQKKRSLSSAQFFMPVAPRPHDHVRRLRPSPGLEVRLVTVGTWRQVGDSDSGSQVDKSALNVRSSCGQMRPERTLREDGQRRKETIQASKQAQVPPVLVIFGRSRTQNVLL